MNKAEIGSMTAKGGFINEADICNKFLNYKNDKEAQLWLEVMGYVPDKIQSIVAIQIPSRINLDKAISLGVSQEKFDETKSFKKADVQIRVKIIIDSISYIENISLKKANTSAAYNQVDKRPVSKYKKIWGFDDEIEKYLKLFTGEIKPESVLSYKELANLRDLKKRRLFLDEIPVAGLQKIIDFFTKNKTLIVTDTLKGRGGLSAEWFLVTQKNSDNSLRWIIKDINTVCNYYAQGTVKLSPRKSLKIARLTMQRKGGTPDPTSLQFKINPLELFNA